MNYEQKLKELALADERIIVMTAENRAALRSMPAALRDRFIDTGITEQCMIGAAAGLALRGRHVVAHALAAFLTLRSFEFIRTDLGIGNLPVKLVGAVPGFLSDGNGPTHQAIEDIERLQQAINRIAERRGSAVDSWNDLRAAGVLRGIPLDPTGEPYRLSPGGRVGISQMSRLFPLPIEPQTRPGA